MSILLDALKKSEKQRQLGETPTLNTPVDDAPKSVSGTSRWLPLVLLLVVVILGWMSWQRFGGWDSADAPAEVTQEVGAAPESVKEHAAGQEAAAKQKAAAKKKREQEAGAERTPVEEFQAAQTGGKPQPAGKGKPKEKQAPVTAAKAGPQAKNDDSLAAVNRSFNEYSTADALPGQDEQAAAEPSSAPAAVSEPDEPVRPRPRKSRRPAEPNAPITFWELPQGVRDGLPELRITVLVYSEKPEERFVLIAGQRLKEKDEAPGGLVLDEIRRDGAVFVYRNYRFLIKG
jgi:general secretion pathway protein B